MREMGQSVTNASEEINRVKGKSGNADAAFIRNICRKLSEPIGQYATKLKIHVTHISFCWNKIENSYLELLDNQFAREPKNVEEFKKSITALREMQAEIDKFIGSLQGSTGMERRLNKSINSLISEFQTYVIMTDAIASSVDHIISKSSIIIHEGN